MFCLRKFHGKTPVLDSLFKHLRFLKRESNTGLSREICKMFKNTYFVEHLRTTASVVSFPIKNCPKNILVKVYIFQENHPNCSFLNKYIKKLCSPLFVTGIIWICNIYWILFFFLICLLSKDKHHQKFTVTTSLISS